MRTYSAELRKNLFWIMFLSLSLFWVPVFTKLYGEILGDSNTHSTVNPVFLAPGTAVNGSEDGQLNIFCHESVKKSLIYFWRSTFVEFKMAPERYEVFDGENATEVSLQSKEGSKWMRSIFPWQDSVLTLPSFNQHCIGIVANGKFTLQLTVRGINFWKALQTAVGVLLFFCAPGLSRNSFFHYTTGVSFGVIASILILIYILSKLIPKKPAAYSILVFGFSVVLYGLQILVSNIQEIIINYSNAVLVYVIASAFTSFVICYRLGPVTNGRTLNLIQWTMQLAGILLIFFSSEYREASTALVIIIITAYAVPASWIAKMKNLWCYYFPPKVKLLTEMEYIEQGNRETKKALENLRAFCRSPECNTWSTVRKLKDPVRFATFIDGESHLSDDEILEYESESTFPDIPLEDEEEDDDDNSATETHSRPTVNHTRYSYSFT